jgi:hypothetical protein
MKNGQLDLRSRTRSRRDRLTFVHEPVEQRIDGKTMLTGFACDTGFSLARNFKAHNGAPSLAYRGCTSYIVNPSAGNLFEVISFQVIGKTDLMVGSPACLEINIEPPQGRKQLKHVLRLWRIGRLLRCCRIRGREFECLKNDILGIFESAGLESLVDQRLDFGLGDLNGHDSRLYHHYCPMVDRARH